EEHPKPAQVRILFEKETELQETPIGKIPKEWKIATLKDIALISSGNTAPQEKKYFEGGKFPFIRVQHLNNLEEQKYPTQYDLINELAISELKLKKFRKGSIIFPKSGESIRLEKRAILREDSFVVNHLAVVEPIHPEVHNMFLFYYLCTIKTSNYLAKTTMPSLNLSTIQTFHIPLPPVVEQKVIAEILSTVDSAIDRVRRLVERAEKLKKGLMQELLTKGIGHKEYKETPIGKIPKEWRVVRLGEVCNPVREIIEPRSSDVSAPYVGLEHVEPGRFFLTRWGTAKEVISSKYKFRKGDILYGRLRPYLDKCVIATIDGLCSTDFIVIRANANLILPEYMVAILHTEKFIKYATSTMRGTNHPRTSWESISRYLLPLPPINEQAEISNILLSIDRYIGLLKNKHELLSHIKRSLMNILLTGKVRIIVDSSEGVSGG
ncbi:MAG: restriction endonuclease subunit S, partial [Sulfolobales archaeon]